jgi:hypothetical protein
MNRKTDPRDLSDDGWAFGALCLTLMTEGAPQRVHCLREVFNGLRWLVWVACHGKRSTNRRTAGREPASSRPIYMTCVPCCG